MRVLVPLLSLTLLLYGCSGPATPPAQPENHPEPAPSDAATPPEQGPVNMSGSISLKFFEPDIGDGQARGATFEVSSPQSSMLEDGVWALTSAKAIVYGKDGGQTLFEAGSAQFDDNSKTAMLKGGVTVEIGSQHVEMEEMTWSNENRVARSDRPVKVTDGETRLAATAMEYEADTKTLLLHGVTGTISLEEGSTAP